MEETLKQDESHCIKIVLFGPESTGKTILAKKLATHFNTLWVPEFSRIYAENKAKLHEVLTQDDVLPIAEGQMALENKLTKQADKLLICDTDLLETKVYSESYYQDFTSERLNKFATENYYNLYFLTNIDLPWEPDGIRDKPHERETMFQAFQKALEIHQKPYILLSGNLTNRFEVAVKHINELLKSKI
ncbi:MULTISPECIES: AAA family ATPase [unclassified Bizionia]|uniref:AAA family ATPase n=1 Tax=unclassified Bizionia TaxID=2626393 RepID=UPI00206F31EC|nr:ATP-binding protein [Bizionia sp. M204]UPS92301.1 AAA family ATPase [Bizionia sp. M204]